MSIVSFILTKKQGTKTKNLAKVAKSVAVVTVAVCVAVILIGYAVVGGYKNQLINSVSSVFGNYKIYLRDSVSRWVMQPVDMNSDVALNLQKIQGVQEVVFGAKSGAVLKSAEGMTGVVVNGVNFEELSKSPVYEFVTQYQDVAISGEEVILSEEIVLKNNLEIGDDVTFVFFGEDPVMVSGTLVGTFCTHLAEIDQSVVWMSLEKINQVLGYPENQTEFIKVTLEKNANKEAVEEQIDLAIPDNYTMSSVEEEYSHFFDWVVMLDNNITLLLIIVSIVAGINIISVVLIVILENTFSIGVLKSLGMKNRDLMLVYGLKTIYTSVLGVVIGVFVGLVFCWVQQEWAIVSLDPQSYMVDLVPIRVSLVEVLSVSLGALFLTVVFAIIPTFVIAKIYPYKTLKFQ